MDPKLDEAFLKAIKAYYEGIEGEEYNKAQPDRKYNKKFFDSQEEKRIGKVHPKTPKQKFYADKAAKEEKKKVKESKNAYR